MERPVESEGGGMVEEEAAAVAGIRGEHVAVKDGSSFERRRYRRRCLRL